MRTICVVFVLSAYCAVPGAGVSYGQASVPAMPPGQRPAPVEKNPPGDIPDNQVFVLYRSPLGFSIKVPEGWARRETTDSVTFTDKYNVVGIMVSPRAQRPTLEDLRTGQVRELQVTGRAISVSALKSVGLPSGRVFVVSYRSNSERNPVTNKEIRLDNERYFFWKDGRLATLTVSAPSGADNADQWQLMAKSFGWQ
ncbi:hypothetical protein [Paraburkholderia sp. BL10I2N1]|uniref:hypothetical protein n=1 Tax=Paraburkholderia sp. BL10I2N1 TaxID=1938796 RepID=UPI00105F8929|nr:hypothetical protein [Paraburkholderia sp. BL10I2N1]TDN57859.1 hypothetical protein B0G77_8701 [Paraburkholderia sp. BL10I2N1]